MTDRMSLGDTGDEHEVGNPKCEEGWCGGSYGFPKPCDCGGLIHASFGDAHFGGVDLIERCDKCQRNP